MEQSGTQRSDAPAVFSPQPKTEVEESPPFSDASKERARNIGGWADLQAASEVGKHAEDWFYARLASAFQEWKIARRERDSQNRESDFVLRRGESSFHIETKRVSALPGLIYWSELQFAKASELGKQYCIAILLQKTEAYEVSWVWQPIVQLSRALRYIEWVWEGRKIEQLRPGSWQIPITKPQIPPRNHLYRITVNESLYRSLEIDTADLLVLKKKLEAWQANALARPGP